ncbi:phosphatase PAP2 family protein [Mucilaginibacter endophyticus]|uniref:phosphatase PAP2 family protein n=1 Tax=Mucilaginibacter endophyticus TaxID=2675003 RepID=UPI000E0D2332|nr:phosphatase PAP2 family protein [Mucilaginibacter endophyticus]
MLNITTLYIIKRKAYVSQIILIIIHFPSGHTCSSFAGAEFRSQELGDRSATYSVVRYAFATTTKVFRVYHTDHWLSDVIAGAGFGILSTKAAHLLYPNIRNNLFKAGREKEQNRNRPHDMKSKKKENNGSILFPSFGNGALVLQFVMSL